MITLGLLLTVQRKALQLFKHFLLAVIVLLTVCSVQAQENFYWKWELVNDSLQVSSNSKGRSAILVKLLAAPVKENFSNIYRIIDLLTYERAKEYNATVRSLSNELVKPFASQILSCRNIVVTIDSSLINLPLEFLEVNGQSIALIKPMVFQLKGSKAYEDKSIRLKKGLIIRDPTADPEDACATTFYRYPTSTYKSAFHVNPASIKKSREEDFLLISTHGFIDSATGKGRILFRDSILSPAFFSENDFGLVYLDACQQGVNWSYLSALLKSKNQGFYLGPIVSNDSGESSTKTINWFFSEMRKNGGDAVKAIWHTRNRLYRNYNKKIHQLDVINKAFIFRIYKT